MRSFKIRKLLTPLLAMFFIVTGLILQASPVKVSAGDLPDGAFGSYNNNQAYFIDPETGNATSSTYSNNPYADAGAKSRLQSETSALTNFIMIFVRMAGIIVIAVGVIKLIMAFNEHMPMGKMQSMNIISLGIVLLSVSFTMTSIVTIFSGSSSTGTDMTTDKLEPILDVLKAGFFIVGIILAMYGVIKIAASFQSERVEEKLEGGRMVAIAAALVSVGYIVDGIATAALGSPDTADTEVFKFIIKDIAVPITVIMAVPLLLASVLNFAEAYREDNPAAKTRAIPQFISGILMVSIGTILGIT